MMNVVCHTTPYFATIYITFMHSKSFLKASGRSNTLLTQKFALYQIKNISAVTLQNPLNFIFPLGSKANKFRRNY